MSIKIKTILYYLIIIILFIIFDKILYILPGNKDCVINNVLLMENKDLKKEINELTNIDYNDYDYEIGKITYHNLYNSNTYFVEYNSTFDNNIVLNDNGMIGTVSNHVLTLVKDLSLSVKINNNYGILKDNKISIISGDYEEGTPIYTSGITSISDEYLIGYVNKVSTSDIESSIDIKYIDINSDYVVILK